MKFRFCKIVRLLFIPLSIITLNAQIFELKDIIDAIEKNSLEIVDNRANFESMINERKSALAWEYPYLDAEGGVARDSSVGARSADWSAVFMVKPKLWWVNTLLRDSLKSKGVQYQKNYELIKNINFIGVKRIYLTYVLTKEKYQYYLKREENFLQLLDIAKKRLNGGSISRKDYVSFESAYIDSIIATISIRNELLGLQRMLFIILGLEEHEYVSHFEPDAESEKPKSAKGDKSVRGASIGSNAFNTLDSLRSESTKAFLSDLSFDSNPHSLTSPESTTSNTASKSITSRFPLDSLSLNRYSLNVIDFDDKLDDSDIRINGLDFAYINLDEGGLDSKLNGSLYVDILDSQAKEYRSLAGYEGRNLWGSLEIGAGVNYSLQSYNPMLKFTLPLPVTKKHSMLKAKYMSLESGAVNKLEITKRQLRIKAKSYIHELELQRKYIDIARNNMEVKRHLAELNRIAYETQQTSLFEYITQANAFVDSQIVLVSSQIKYVDIIALLEETLGESFTAVE